MEKLESGLRGWNVDLNEETGESIEQTEKWKRFTLEKLARSLSVMCWNMDFLEEMAVLSDGYGSESGGCNVFDRVQADRRLMWDAKSLGYVWPTSLPPLRCESVQTAFCAEDTRRCWSVLAAASSRTIARMAERNCGGAVGRKECIRSRGSSSCLQGKETTRCESVFDGLDCCNLEWKLHEGTSGNGSVEQTPNEQRLASRGARISGHLHTDHGTGTARFDQHLDKSETGLETGRLRAVCDLLCGRCGVGCCVGCCCGSDGGRGNRKTERGRSVCWCTEIYWTSHPKIIDGCIVVHGLAVLREEVLEFVGSKVCLGGSARYVIADRTAQANNCLAKWRPVLRPSWLPRMLRLSVVKTTTWQAFLWSSSVWTTETKLRVGVQGWWRT